MNFFCNEDTTKSAGHYARYKRQGGAWVFEAGPAEAAEAESAPLHVGLLFGISILDSAAQKHVTGARTRIASGWGQEIRKNKFKEETGTDQSPRVDARNDSRLPRLE